MLPVLGKIYGGRFLIISFLIKNRKIIPIIENEEIKIIP
tara:strand:- start:17 stop:133 length:117 start_codon:yes stop_codon:yes gene_type:complete